MDKKNKKDLTPKQIIIGVIVAVLISIVALFIIEQIALAMGEQRKKIETNEGNNWVFEQ